VDLFEVDEREFLRAESGLKPFTIFDHVFTGVPIGEAEIERLLAIEIGDAAGGGAETVEEPGKFFEGVEFEDS